LQEVMEGTDDAVGGDEGLFSHAAEVFRLDCFAACDDHGGLGKPVRLDGSLDSSASISQFWMNKDISREYLSG
jgi:hypothetical protein